MEDEKWFAESEEEIIKKLNSNKITGITEEEVKNRQEKYGLNELQEKAKTPMIIKFLEQFKNFMIIILIIAAIVSGVVGYLQGEGFTDSIIIFIVVIVNAIIGVAQENKAEKSLEALKKLSSYSAKVVRNGKILVVPSKELIPGDIVILETGDYVPADIRLIEAVNLKAQESSLTGESVPVEKYTNIIKQENVGIGDRANMLFSSSLVTYGRGKGIVVETGMNTEVGKIAGILNNTEKSETPLQQRLNKLGKTLGIASLIICAIIFLIGMLQGKEAINMFMTAVSLAVAVIPEGLAAVSTIVLAIGVQRMVKKHAIVKKLPAVETLGSTSVICSDKTGTLTKNQMTVQKLFYNNKIVSIKEIDTNIENEELEKLVNISMLCNDTKIGENRKLTGDPTETALVDMGFKLDFTPAVFEQMPRAYEIPFDSDRKMMTTVHKISDNKFVVFTKGGVDELLEKCSAYQINGKIEKDLENAKKIIDDANDELAEKALRVLAMAYKEIDYMPTTNENLEENLIYVGMVGMIDPPREEVKDAIQKCKTAGIKTVMITGDHKSTAIAIARELGILEDRQEAITGSELANMSDEELTRRVENIRVYARVSPEHKVRIVRAWQAHGQIVAMTGDGVNDAPALKNADIGCAMGKCGTDVAKEAADIILTDDNFATVVSAVEEGRRIYDNIIKVIQFLLASNVGEVVILFLAILLTPYLANRFGIPIDLIEPLLPIHILWINLVTDSLPALALAFDPSDKEIMKRQPVKSNTGIFAKSMTWRIAYQGIMIGVLSLISFIIGLATRDVPTIEGLTNEQVKVEIGQTMTFIVLAFSELIHVLNIRNNKESIFKTGIGGNKQLFGAIAISSLLMIVILAIPALRSIFSIPVLPIGNIIEIIILILAPVAIVEIFKLLKINGKTN